MLFQVPFCDNLYIIFFSTKDDFQIVIKGTSKSNKPCRIWTEVLDRKDNFFIVRYKLYEVCSQLNISGSYQGDGLGQILHTNVLPDDCICPLSDIDNFLESWKCGPVPVLLEEQLKQFGNINWDKKRQEASLG